MEPLNKILDAVAEHLANAWAFIKYPMETTAAKSAWAYWKVMLAGTVTVFPALALFMNGQTTIAPEQARKPDEHLQSQSQTADTTLEGANLFNVGTTSGVVSVRASDIVQVSEWESAFTVAYETRRRQRPPADLDAQLPPTSTGGGGTPT